MGADARSPVGADAPAGPPGGAAAIRWLAGDAPVQQALARAWSDPGGAGVEVTLLRDRPGRRRHLRLRWPDGGDLFVKQFYARGPRHRLRRRMARLLRLEAARREWRGLRRLARAGVPVPRPRALGVLPGGDRILAVDFVPSRSLEAALAGDGSGPERGADLAVALGRLVAALHDQGIVHRDLHHGNVLLAEKGPVLLDLQLARPGRARRARLRDVGQLEASLGTALSLAQRVRLRAAALRLTAPFDAEARAQLRAAGDAAAARARARAASRSRRALRPGRRFAALATAGARGLRLRALDPAALMAALADEEAGRGESLRRDEHGRVAAVRAGAQRLVVRRSRPDGLSDALAWRLRGSPARRGWRAGFALEAHGIAAARPLALLERRRLGLAVEAILVVEDLRPARPAPDLVAERAEEVVDAVCRLAGRLHARGILHGGLSADRVWLRDERGTLVAAVAGLEEVRLRARLSDAQRIAGLARLHATLPDAGDAGARRRAFSRYALLQPFAGGRALALERIVATSRTGRVCGEAT